MKKAGLKKVYLFFSSVVIFLLHLPFGFAKNRPVGDVLDTPVIEKEHTSTVALNVDPNLVSGTQTSLYDSLKLGSLGLARQTCEMALRGWYYLVAMGKLPNDDVLTIVDFSKPSSTKRLYVIDVEHCKLLFNTYVAHGVNSGKEFANQFSNTPESNKSSLGFYVTGNTYMGGNGYSLRLNGLEPGFNDNALRRDIVMHGAEYVNENFIHSQGYIGRSWGCPAVEPKLSKPIINQIKNGTCMFLYAQNNDYLKRSSILRRSA